MVTVPNTNTAKQWMRRWFDLSEIYIIIHHPAEEIPLHTWQATLTIPKGTHLQEIFLAANAFHFSQQIATYGWPDNWDCTSFLEYLGEPEYQKGFSQWQVLDVSTSCCSVDILWWDGFGGTNKALEMPVQICLWKFMAVVIGLVLGKLNCVWMVVQFAKKKHSGLQLTSGNVPCKKVRGFHNVLLQYS